MASSKLCSPNNEPGRGPSQLVGGLDGEAATGLLASMEGLIAALQEEEDVALILDRDSRIQFVNSAWTTHAERANATSLSRDRVLGRPYLSFVSGLLQAIVKRHLSRVLEGADEFGATLHGECSTPEQLRKLSSYFAPIVARDGQIGGVVIRHTVRVEAALSERYAIAETAPESFRQPSGVVRQCGCCRRVQHPTTGRWQISIPLLQTPDPSTSHSICESCVEVYYPEEP